MKSYFLCLTAVIFLVSCGSDSDMPGTDPGDNNTGDQQITQLDYDAIVTPCADESETVNLPVAMTIMDNYIQYEATRLESRY